MEWDMKKRFLGLLLVGFVSNNTVCSNMCGDVIELTYEENRALDAFYLHDANGTLLEVLNPSHIDYYLRILPLHIKILENKRAQLSGSNEVLWLLLFFYTGMSVWFGWPLYNKIQQFMAGNLGRVWIPSSMLDNLRSIRFTRAEKRKLDLVSFENIDDSFYGSYDKIYTAIEKEKIIYLGKRLALKKIKKDICMASVMPACCALLEGAFLYNLYMGVTIKNGNKRLDKELERDNRLLELLKHEKETKNWEIGYEK